MPNLFLVGAPKCGTTSLSSFLSVHPQVYAPAVKEPQYFASDFPRRMVSSQRTYVSLYSGAPAQAKWLLDASTVYLFSQTALHNIAATCPDAHFIAILRDPVKMVPSWHNQMLLRFFEDQRCLRSAWDSIGKRRRGISVPQRCPYPRFLYYDEIARFGAQLEVLRSLVPPERVRVFLLDDFIQDEVAARNTLLEFLGLHCGALKDEMFPRNNKAKDWRFPTIAKLASSPAIRRVRLKLGIRVNGGEKHLSLLFKPSSCPIADDGVLQEISSAYADDVKSLEAAIGRPLPGWLHVP